MALIPPVDFDKIRKIHEGEVVEPRGITGGDPVNDAKRPFVIGGQIPS